MKVPMGGGTFLQKALNFRCPAKRPATWQHDALGTLLVTMENGSLVIPHVHNWSLSKNKTTGAHLPALLWLQHMAYYITTEPLGKRGQWIENWHQMHFLATILHHSQLRHSNQENFLTIAGESASKTMVTVLAPMTKVAMMWNHHVSTCYFLLVASKEKYGVMNVGFFKWWKAMLTQKHWNVR